MDLYKMYSYTKSQVPKYQNNIRRRCQIIACHSFSKLSWKVKYGGRKMSKNVLWFDER